MKIDYFFITFTLDFLKNYGIIGGVTQTGEHRGARKVRALEPKEFFQALKYMLLLSGNKNYTQLLDDQKRE